MMKFLKSITLTRMFADKILTLYFDPNVYSLETITESFLIQILKIN